MGPLSTSTPRAWGPLQLDHPFILYVYFLNADDKQLVDHQVIAVRILHVRLVAAQQRRPRTLLHLYIAT